MLPRIETVVPAGSLIKGNVAWAWLIPYELTLFQASAGPLGCGLNEIVDRRDRPQSCPRRRRRLAGPFNEADVEVALDLRSRQKIASR